MDGFIFAIIVVASVRSFAFCSPNSYAFAGDIGVVVFWMIFLNPMFKTMPDTTLGLRFRRMSYTLSFT
jgi:hypothetical protein